MISNYQDESNLFYTKAIKNTKRGLHNVSGRYKADTKLEKYIFKDIAVKLELNKKKISFLDVGCGCGNLVKFIAKHAEQKKINLTLCDIEPVISKLKKQHKNKKIKFLDNEFLKNNFTEKYDRILIYSVLQCMNDIKKSIEKAYSLLKKNGILLIGDLPNVDKKFRFLSIGSNKKNNSIINKNIKQKYTLKKKL